MFALAVALSVAQNQQGLPLGIEEGGFCTGLAWVQTDQPAVMTVDRGPDFRVFRFDKSSSEWWGIYAGNASQVGSGEKKVFFRRDGVQVESVTVDGTFRGYLATDKEGFQNHFFGSPFRNDRSDLAFFAAVDFGAAGKSLCSKHPVQ